MIDTNILNHQRVHDNHCWYVYQRQTRSSLFVKKQGGYLSVAVYRPKGTDAPVATRILTQCWADTADKQKVRVRIWEYVYRLMDVDMYVALRSFDKAKACRNCNVALKKANARKDVYKEYFLYEQLTSTRKGFPEELVRFI